MTRLIVFGDSYGSNHENVNWQWFKLLAQSLQVEYKTYAVGGTSLQYSIDQFGIYLENEYNKNDYIVFLTTHSVRTPFWPNKENIGWGGYLDTYFLDGYKNNKNKKLKEIHEKYNEYKKEYRFIYDYVMSDMRNKTNFLLVKNTMENLKNKHIILQCFDDVYNLYDDHKFVLFDISKNEYLDLVIEEDTRPNHMSEINHCIFAEQLHNYLLHNTPLDKNKFKKKL